MTVLLQDAKKALEIEHGMRPAGVCSIGELVYADGTLLVDVSAEVVDRFMQCMGKAGSQYGLSFNWSKLEAMPINMEVKIEKPDGVPLKTKGVLKYLGCHLSSDGRVGSELGRRLGQAKRDIQNLGESLDPRLHQHVEEN